MKVILGGLIFLSGGVMVIGAAVGGFIAGAMMVAWSNVQDKKQEAGKEEAKLPSWAADANAEAPFTERGREVPSN